MSILSDIRAGAGQVLCSAFQNYEDVGEWAAGLFYPSRVDDVFPLSPAGQFANTGLSIFCDRPPFPPPQVPFAGGQCPGTRYDVTYEFDVIQDGQPDGQRRGIRENLLGPIESVRIDEFGASTSQVIIVHNSGTESSGIFETGASTQWINPRIVNTVTSNGSPDDCGDPPLPTYEPTPPGAIGGPINIGGDNVNISFSQPTLNVGGFITVGFQSDDDTYDFSGEVNLNTGDVTITTGGGKADNPCCEDVAVPDGDPPPPEEEPQEEDGPGNIVGAIVVLTSDNGFGKATEIQQDNVPNIYAPRLGDVTFQLRIGNRFFFSQDYPVKNNNQYVSNPTGIPAVAAFVTAQPGYTLSITPVRSTAPLNEFTV